MISHIILGVVSVLHGMVTPQATPSEASPHPYYENAVMASLISPSQLREVTATPRASDENDTRPTETEEAPPSRTAPRSVPYYSQFTDIRSPVWQKRGCGIASIAMVIDFHTEYAPSANVLLEKGIAADAYIPRVGWKHQGLVRLTREYGLQGTPYDLRSRDTGTAFTRLQRSVAEGPVIASVHNKFDPQSTIPHLVVITDMQNDRVYYNDPAATSAVKGSGSISRATFQEAWKQMYIELSPVSRS